jgi:chromate reductase
MAAASAAPAKLVRVLALSGSLRKLSANSALLRFAQSSAAALGAEIVVAEVQLPLFDQDVEAAGFPPAAQCVPARLSARARAQCRRPTPAIACRRGRC